MSSGTWALIGRRIRAATSLGKGGRAWVVLVGVDIGLRVLRFGLGIAPLRADTLGYWTLAQQTSSGDWAWAASGEAFRVPAYPAFLAVAQTAAGEHALLAAVVFQHAIGMATNIVLASLVGLITRSQVAARIAYAFALTGVARVAFGSALMPESLFMLFITAGMGLLMTTRKGHPSWRQGLAAGICLGFAALTKPLGQYLPAVALIIPAVALTDRKRSWPQLRRSLPTALAVALAFAVVVSPWIVRNYTLHGKATLSFGGGISLWWSAIDERGARLNMPTPLLPGESAALRKSIDSNGGLDVHGVHRELRRTGL